MPIPEVSSFFKINSYVYLFYILVKVLPPFSLPSLSSHLPSTLPQFPPFLWCKEQASHGYLQIMASQAVVRLNTSLCMKAGQCDQYEE